jgi:hypothetical protein
LAASVVLAAAACGSTASQDALPGRRAGAELARVHVARPTVRQQVITAYEGYWLATSRAIDSRSAVAARTILRGHIPSSAIPGLVKGLTDLWRRHELAYGNPVFHIMTVAFTGASTVAVHDCIDLSGTGFQNTRTGQMIGAVGQSHDFLITTLARENGQWLITGAISVVRPCAY